MTSQTTDRLKEVKHLSSFIRPIAAFMCFAFLLTGSSLALEAQENEKELPDVKVLYNATSEQSLVGPNKQPEWTARPHRFATTRTYVLPPGVIEADLWAISEFDEGARPAYEFQEELLFGLPNRFQLDFYQVQSKTGSDSLQSDAHKVEVRWALNEWGEIPLNPTLYVEWESDSTEDSDAVEYKLLLAENLAPKWYWAGNAVYEQEYSNNRETEFALTSGLNYTVKDRKFNVGVEGEVERKTEDGSRGDPEWEFLAGPSLQYRFTPSIRLRWVTLGGFGADSPDVESFLIFGFTLSEGPEWGREQTVTAERK